MSSSNSTGELGFQRHSINALCADAHWHERKASQHYDRDHAVDRDMLEEFLGDRYKSFSSSRVRG